ncbi:MAG: GWxTD domain-containing protein, partial [Calditrichaeota bacterium]
DLDFARFRTADHQVRLELYYSFYRNQFTVAKEDSPKVARFEIDVKLFQGDSLARHRNWSNENIFNDSKESNNEMFLSISKFVLSPGVYRCVTTIKDLNSEREGVAERTIPVKGFPDKTISMSDIELATSVAKDTTRSNGVFRKGSYQVIPNPGALFGPHSPMLFFYTELYNLSDSSYAVEYSILDGQNRIYRSFPPQPRKGARGELVEVGGINSVTFPGGKYTLRIRLFDSAGNVVATGTKRFYTYRQYFSRGPVARSSRGTEGALEDLRNASEEALDREFHSAAYLATKEESAIFDQLKPEGKRRFLMEFWAKRPGKRAEHLQRLQYAERQYGGIRPGWRTDRGRVVIKYGEPDQVDKNPSLRGKHGYEIWRYFQHKGGLIFVFVDKGGKDDLELVHSNAPGEISDPNWKRWIE